MSNHILGIHHITAIAGDPQQNLDFYTGVLGLRLVKLTVNFDDPGTYHLYFGDRNGSPGSILTFFPWPGAQKGRRGSGQATTVSFSAPENSLGFWMERLKQHGVGFELPERRFDEEVLAFEDPHGLRLELVVASGEPGFRSGTDGRVPAEHSLIGFHSVTLTEASWEGTSTLLTEVMNFRMKAHDGNRVLYSAPGSGRAALVDVEQVPGAARGFVSVGTVHHVAWRVPDDQSQRLWRHKLVDRGIDVTSIIDRKYFRSIYFHEPGGVLFEIATDPPGFAVDERPEELGTHLMLPLRLESARSRIEQQLPRIVLSRVDQAA